jgi:hypothetical protein
VLMMKFMPDPESVRCPYGDGPGPCTIHCRQRGQTMMYVEWWIWHCGTDHICNLFPGHDGLCWCHRCGYSFPKDMTRAEMARGVEKWNEITLVQISGESG